MPVSDFKVGDEVRCVDGTMSSLLEGRTYTVSGVWDDLLRVRGQDPRFSPTRFIKLPTTITSITPAVTTPATPKATFGERREPVSSLAEFQQIIGDGGNDVGGIIPVTIELMSQLSRADQRHAFAVRPEIGDRQRAANDGMLGHKEVPTGNAKTSAPNPKDLIGITKVQVGLFPSAGTIEGARAMEDGAKKYGAYNWREHAVRMTVYLDALERHLLALRDGEDDAEDSKVSHLGHILSCAAIIADAKACGNLIDDRPHKGAASALFAKYKKEAA